jgi:rubrerythrin
MKDVGLEKALAIAMDAELKAQAFYAQAVIEVQDPKGRDLLSRLAAFEGYHYQRLAELAQSLQEGGQFIEYEARRIEQFAPSAGGEAAGTELQGLKDEAAILGTAIDNEKAAGERYRALAEDTTDAAGQRMFRTLADEERMHERILADEFFSLSNQGVWSWSGMYGD